MGKRRVCPWLPAARQPRSLTGAFERRLSSLSLQPLSTPLAVANPASALHSCLSLLVALVEAARVFSLEKRKWLALHSEWQELVCKEVLEVAGDVENFNASVLPHPKVVQTLYNFPLWLHS